MSKSRVKVVIRTRPTSAFVQEFIQFAEDKKSIHIHIPKNEEYGYINNQQENWDFKFDKILHNASQETMYEECGVPIVRSLLEGYNATILAYGQTGAGKTFTMTGASENYKHRGLIPRAISHLFKDISERVNLAFTIRISYLEIYNEQMIDLLSTLSDNVSNENMAVVEDRTGSTHVKGLTVKIANTEEEALNLLFEGETNRSISEHQLNRNSSSKKSFHIHCFRVLESHCIFTIYVESRSRVESSEKVMTSKLNLVDLAGSERLSKTETKGITLKEAMYINRSLTYLEQVIIALADKKRDHIPFRQSKMTHVLRDALGGNCNTLMIANCWGEKVHIEETISTLRFATRMMCVAVSPEINIQYDPLALIKKYEKEIKELKQELSMHDTLTNRSHIQYESYTETQRAELTKIVKSFIENELEEPEIVNIRQIREMLSIFRLLYKTLEAEIGDGSHRNNKPTAASSGDGAREGSSHARKIVSQTEEREDGVGEVEGSGFGVGMAPIGKAINKGLVKAVVKKKPTAASNENEDENGQVDGDTHDGYVIDQTMPMTGNRKNGPLSRAEEFELFKRGRGSEMSRILAENKLTLKTKKKLAKDLAEQVNDIKKQIDEIKLSLALKKQIKQMDGSQMIMDQEEYNNISHLKKLKEEYKATYDSLKPLRSDIEYCFRLTDQCRQKLMTEFEQWYEQSFGPQFSDQNKGQTDDVLDIGEKFDRLQMERMSLEDPDSLPFYNAKKNSDRRSVKAPKRQLAPIRQPNISRVK
ncbi:P-loop containing nucleoside triphosphate hydrolase protein [Globomyces pollinis-pini]|nr:P-loop containing nucleoside triphosphate hydrolase protein [Globomyces pollinis-pini]